MNIKNKSNGQMKIISIEKKYNFIMIKSKHKKLDKWKVIIVYNEEKKKAEYFELDDNQRLAIKMPIYKRPKSKKGITNILLQEKDSKLLNQDQSNTSLSQCRIQSEKFIFDKDNPNSMEQEDKLSIINNQIDIEISLNQDEKENDSILLSDLEILDFEQNSS